jgi:nucleoside-diphosphate-sugar epimerase
VRLFAFGLGYCARHVIARGNGFEASGTVRSAAGATALRAEGVEAFAFDGDGGGEGLREEGLAASLARAEILLISAPPGPAGDPALGAFAREIATARELRRIVYLSTVGVYGDWGGAWVDETSPTRTTSPRGRWRVAAETQWREIGAARGIPVDVLRLAGIYGPERNALVKLRQGDARRIVKPGQVFNRIHVFDIAQAVLHLLAAEKPGETWNVADEEPAPPQDVIAFAAELLGIDPPPEEPFEGAPMSPMARGFYEDNRRVRIDKLKRELGYVPLYPTYRDGLRALAAAGDGRA